MKCFKTIESVTKENLKRRNALRNIFHEKTALQWLFCVLNVVSLYDLQINIVEHFFVHSKYVRLK